MILKHPLFPKARFILVVPLLAALTGCSDPGSPETLATYQGGEVTIEALETYLESQPEGQRQPSPGQNLEGWLEERIADVALPRIVLARARAAALQETPPLRLKARFLASQDVGRRFLEKACPSEEVPENEVLEAFDTHFPSEPQPWVLVRHIFKRFPNSASDAERNLVRSEMARIHREIQEGEDFGALAREHSDSATAEEGGLIGRISQQAPMEPKVREGAWALADGEVSTPIEVRNGIHIVKRSGSGVEEPQGFEQVRPMIEERLGLQAREVCGAGVLKKLGEEQPMALDFQSMRDNDLHGVVLAVGDERFSLEELNGLSPDGTALSLMPRPADLVRHFLESVLLARAFQGQSDEASATYQAVLARAVNQQIQEAQWRVERRRWLETRPEEELKAYFTSHQERFNSELRLDVEIIFFTSTGKPGRRPILERAQRIQSLLLRGEDFASLALEHSSHPSSADGGRLGVLPLSRLQVILGSRAIGPITQLEVGELSAPLLIQDSQNAAFALVKLLDRHEPQPRSYEAAREDVIDAMSKDRVQALNEEVRASLIQEIHLEVNARSMELFVAGLSD